MYQKGCLRSVYLTKMMRFWLVLLSVYLCKCIDLPNGIYNCNNDPNGCNYGTYTCNNGDCIVLCSLNQCQGMVTFEGFGNSLLIHCNGHSSSDDNDDYACGAIVTYCQPQSDCLIECDLDSCGNGNFEFYCSNNNNCECTGDCPTGNGIDISNYYESIPPSTTPTIKPVNTRSTDETYPPTNNPTINPTIYPSINPTKPLIMNSVSDQQTIVVHFRGIYVSSKLLFFIGMLTLGVCLSCGCIIIGIVFYYEYKPKPDINIPTLNNSTQIQRNIEIKSNISIEIVLPPPIPSIPTVTKQIYTDDEGIDLMNDTITFDDDIELPISDQYKLVSGNKDIKSEAVLSRKVSLKQFNE